MAIGGIWGAGSEPEQKITITFNVTPENATLVLKDAEKQTVEPKQDKTYIITPRIILL